MSYQDPTAMKALRDLAGWLRHWHWHDDSDVGIAGHGLADQIDEYVGKHWLMKDRDDNGKPVLARVTALEKLEVQK